ncbi:glycoside hydrolase family 127 protein [Amphibacillus cookii]|uniref:glycoside hydrolase family 127 protein n=1 Tax=Amphibacillus cookii TaxID=767787 RepID=UPI00195E219E|nr:glycoside hydrolase family 127 protein [Amphibacillus cookii]MBM7540077.1 DUF1680 family protein [Amphibacillus cookii]
MESVKLNSGFFQDAQQKGKDYLLALEIDRLIAPCYEALGKEAKAPRYGGWEEMEIAGHSAGHWLSAASMMYQYTHDYKLKEKIEYAVDELAYLQKLDADGYVSGFKKDCFEEVFTGEFRVEHFSLAGSWVPWYSIHKIFAGLIDAYHFAHVNKAKDVVVTLANWAERGLRHLTNQQFQRMLICEFGGMNEVMADIYQLTDEKRFLQLAERFNHQVILQPLRNQIDDLAGKHANTQIPKVIGVARLYDLTGKEDYRKIAEYFWDRVVYHRSYVIGGNSHAEHFGREDTEPLGVLTTETCNTYNMLKLTEYLFKWSPDSRYMDYYENALYNHILASQDPDSGMKTYFVSTEPGHFKVYCTPDQSFWCCTGSGMENPARYAKNIFIRQDQSLYINLFIPATITLEDKQLQFTQETRFPYEPVSQLIVNEGSGSPLTLHIRQPYWLIGDSQLRINGERVDYHLEEGYLVISREWFKGDMITWQLPMALHRYLAKDKPDHQAFLYGPVVLAGKLGREQFPETDIVADHQVYNNHPLIDVPTLVTTDPIETWLHLKDQSQLLFETAPIAQPGDQTIELIPFYNLHHERYTLYWRVTSESDYIKGVDKDKQTTKQLREQTIDVVQPGEQQPETEHKIKFENSQTGYLNLVDRHWRDARNGGFVSYILTVEPHLSNTLMVTYYGGDTDLFIEGVNYQREFNILVEGESIVTEKLKAEQPGVLISHCYPIPEQLTVGKSEVEVRFVAGPEKIAGGLYGVRTLR